MTVIAPPNPWLNLSATISKIHDETSGVRTYEMSLDDAEVAASYAYQPGQFNMIYVPGVGESAISISGQTEAGALCHTIRDAGNVTHALAGMKPGASVGLRGPFGSVWPVDECRGKDLIVVGGGIGMAPLRPIIHHVLNYREEFGNVSLLLGSRTSQGLLYGDEMESWQESIRVERTVDRATADWNGNVGVVTTLLDRQPIPCPEDTILMTCGPEVMMRFTVRSALERGLSKESVWLSIERNMNCATGLCGHCQFGPEFVCKDGPVFRFDRIAKLLQVKAL